jgi:hypothetical protein
VASIQYDQDPTQMTTVRPIPDPDELKVPNGKAQQPRRQRLNIQLATTGKWTSKKVSEEGVYWPSRGYQNATQFPATLQDDMVLRCWDLDGNLGQVVAVLKPGPNRYHGGVIEQYIRAFSLVGCKGYLSHIDLTIKMDCRSPTFYFPKWRTKRFRKSRNLSTIRLLRLPSELSPRAPKSSAKPTADSQSRIPHKSG